MLPKMYKCHRTTDHDNTETLRQLFTGPDPSSRGCGVLSLRIQIQFSTTRGLAKTVNKHQILGHYVGWWATQGSPRFTVKVAFAA